MFSTKFNKIVLPIARGGAIEFSGGGNYEKSDGGFTEN